MPLNTIDGVGTTDGLGTPPHQPEDGRPIILVVDDRAINRDFLVSLLNYSGYRTIEANSPTELPSVDHLDLIITDVHMPGMNGLTFLRGLRGDSITRRVPVILYTAAYKTPDIEAKAKELGAFAVLTKPTDPQVILDHVRAALNSDTRVRTATGLGQPVEPEPEAAAVHLPRLGYRSATLIELMLDLGGERDSERLIRNFCYGAKELINAREASVHIVGRSEGEGHLLFSTATGSTSDSPPLPKCDCALIDLAKQAKGRCLRKGEAANLEIAFPPHAASSVLYVPIHTAANHFGCLCLVEKLGEPDFSEEDERLITTLATKLAIVYENIKLYKELERFATRLARESEDRERTQEELDFSRQEQGRLKDEFLSHVSHELRSPVMVLHQFLEILLEGIAGVLNEQQRGYLDIALRNTNQLNTMIGDLLEATRIETGKMRVDLKSMPLADVLNEATNSAKPAANAKHIEIFFDVPAGMPLVVADRSRVRQIVTNFLENAIKFTPENGSITVQAAVDRKHPKFVKISVADTGCGISPEETEKIFDRLYQVPNADSSARKGLGLGLCICKQLAILQGGQIEAKSKPGLGSTFSFTLPVFSLADLITPLLGEGAVPESMVLLTVEVSDNDSLAETHVKASLRETIERCVQPDLDVLLPDSYPSRTGRTFIIVARTDERGAKVLARRLEKQLQLHNDVPELPDRPLVRLSTVALSVGCERLGLAEQRAAAVAKIEESLQGIIADRS